MVQARERCMEQNKLKAHWPPLVHAAFPCFRPAAIAWIFVRDHVNVITAMMIKAVCTQRTLSRMPLLGRFNISHNRKYTNSVKGTLTAGSLCYAITRLVNCQVSNVRIWRKKKDGKDKPTVSARGDFSGWRVPWSYRLSMRMVHNRGR